MNGLTEQDRQVIRSEFRGEAPKAEFIAASVVVDGRHEAALEIAYKIGNDVRYVTVDLLRAAARECGKLAK